MHLSEADRRELLPSGKQPRFDNRVSWAKLHLNRALLLDIPTTGVYQITERGLSVLQTKPASINLKYLDQFPEHLAWRHASKSETTTEAKSATQPNGVVIEQTPEDMLEAGNTAIRNQLALDLFERMKLCSPSFFERLVLDVLIAMGYGGSLKDAAEAVGQTGDGGIDGIIKEDRLGLDAIYVQAKRWQNNVGSETVQSFVGALHGNQAQKGVFITTSKFTSTSQDYVRKIGQKVILIDGEQLAQLMIEYGVGVIPVQTYVVKKINSDYFEG